jgi:SAM-dependent methyltransferase
LDFRNSILALARKEDAILEIGPSYNPIFPKVLGYNSLIMDHANRAELVAKYAAFGVSTDMIEEVDFVTTDLRGIPEQNMFSLIVASHVVEHTADIIEFLQSCEARLRAEGKLALIVPDKRLCFDCFRPLSSPGAMLDAHFSKSRVHLGALFDHYLYFSRRGGALAWGADCNEAHEVIHTTAQCRAALESAIQAAAYVDAHKWVFTPMSFRFAVSELRAAGFSNLGLETLTPTQGYEFMVVLSCSAASEPLSRRDLLLGIDAEIA